MRLACVFLALVAAIMLGTAVTAEGDRIRRGIYRDFPVEYHEPDGRVSLATFEVEAVTRNGAPEPYVVEQTGAYRRTRIGDKDVFLPVPSDQVYQIRYLTTGQLRSHAGYDELYWNVTGDQWEFPILEASVEVRLPDRALIRQSAGYTGPLGATGRDFEVTEAENGIFRARITRPLGAREGFTVALAWPPGVVAVPPVRYGVPGLTGYTEPPMTLGGLRLGPYAALAGTLAGALALFLAWLRVGRDPARGTVYPQFDPPGGLSPAAIRYVRRMGFDPRCLTAAILSMAVKRAVRVTETKSESLFRDFDYTLEPRGERAGLSAGERAAYRALFPGGRTLTLKADKTNGQRVDQAKADLKSALWDEHYGASFRRNGGYTALGVLAGLAAGVVLVGVTERWNMLSVLQSVLGAVGAATLAYAAASVVMMIADYRRSRTRPSFAKLMKVLPIAAFAAVFLVQIGAVFGIPDMLAWLGSPLIAAGAAFGVAAVLFHFLMAAPSKAGRKLMDQIEGFELFMATAEEDRLDILNPPEKTPELFEKLLPYAVALGLAHQWSAKFADVLAGAAAAGAASPAWYSGDGYPDFDRFDWDFSHAVSSTSTPPSRGSSGSGGGGSSGGGGGGGGGGGW